MRKFRVVKKGKWYYPQEKVWGLWMSMNNIGGEVFCINKEDALKHIGDRIKKPAEETVVYEIDYNNDGEVERTVNRWGM